MDPRPKRAASGDGRGDQRADDDEHDKIFRQQRDEVGYRGIRKVLGATVTNLVTLLSKDFIVLVVVGMLIAAPVAYLAMQRWLEAFAYHIELSWWIFLGAGLIALVIAVLTVSYQAIKAALANPVKALRYE